MSVSLLQHVRQCATHPVFGGQAWHFGCNFCAWRHLVNGIARWGISALMALLVLAALFTPQHVTSSHVAPVPAVPLPAPHDPAATPGVVAGEADTDNDTEALVDLYGNDVSPAVATYSFDALGSLYEEHSPQTELPKLGSSKT
jgi:hypothetical protein